MTYPPYSYRDLDGGGIPVGAQHHDASYDSIRAVAHRMGEVYELDKCAGCNYANCPQKCAVCMDNIARGDLDPNFEIQRLCDWAELVVKRIRKIDQARIDLGAAIDSATAKGNQSDAVRELDETALRLCDFGSVK